MYSYFWAYLVRQSNPALFSLYRSQFHDRMNQYMTRFRSTRSRRRGCDTAPSGSSPTPPASSPSSAAIRPTGPPRRACRCACRPPPPRPTAPPLCSIRSSSSITTCPRRSAAGRPPSPGRHSRTNRDDSIPQTDHKFRSMVCNLMPKLDCRCQIQGVPSAHKPGFG